MSNDSLASTTADMAIAHQTKVDAISKTGRKRNRLSAAARKELMAKIAEDYESGKPTSEMMIKYKLSKAQLNGILSELFILGRIKYVKPEYEIASVSAPIKTLTKAANILSDYVRVDIGEDSIKITPYIFDIQKE